MKELHIDIEIQELLSSGSNVLKLSKNQEIFLHFYDSNIVLDAQLCGRGKVGFDKHTNKAVSEHSLIATVSSDTKLAHLFFGITELTANLHIRPPELNQYYKVNVKPSVAAKQKRQHHPPSNDDLLGEANNTLKRQMKI
ncbi:MAG: hypothetical protein ACJAXS_001593 [Colwellia sp.]|jgi:hypothetical protein